MRIIQANSGYSPALRTPAMMKLFQVSSPREALVKLHNNGDLHNSICRGSWEPCGTPTDPTWPDTNYLYKLVWRRTSAVGVKSGVENGMCIASGKKYPRVAAKDHPWRLVCQTKHFSMSYKKSPILNFPNKIRFGRRTLFYLRRKHIIDIP